jgi:hypothetical protein
MIAYEVCRYAPKIIIRGNILIFQPNQSVPQILNVQTIMHALLKNAKIPASQPRVESMLNVGSSSIAQPAFVIEAMLAILIVSAKSVRNTFQSEH